MKVHFIGGKPVFTGALEDMVVYYNPRLDQMIARKKVKPVE